MSNLEIGWDNPEHTVIRLTLHEGWNWSELYEVNKAIIEMMKSTDQTVHLLLDTTHINRVPMGGVITHARNILGAYPPNCDMRILLTRNLLIQRLGSIFQSTFRADLGKRLHTVSSVEEAYRLINEKPRPQGEML
ncbi:MAG: hypothetical protein GC204_07120 [Chloroflexi bacterium]|nr:hypothetical protein [Chloroflexota bacterium]